MCCSYMSVLNRDVSANGFWQGPGPWWTLCWSRKKTGEKEGQEGWVGASAEIDQVRRWRWVQLLYNSTICLYEGRSTAPINWGCYSADMQSKP